MKLLYLSDRCDGVASYGINKKIADQIKAFENYGYDVYHAKFQTDDDGVYCLGIWKNDTCLTKINMSGKFIIKIIQSRKAARFISRFCSENEISVIYARAPYTLILYFIKYFCNKIFIYMEVPTYPFRQELKDDLKSKIIYFIISCINKTHRYAVSAIITYSDHKFIYKIPCINISNGINVNGMPLVIKKNHEEIVFTAVSAIESWHGIDRFLKSLAIYGKSGVKFNIVGIGVDMQRLKDIADQNGYLRQITIFHGFKSGKELYAIYNETDIAIGCLGCHRAGLKSAHSLKNREYCAAGIPMVYSENDQLLDNADFVYKVSPDESLIDIDSIISWYKNLNMPPEEIRKFACEHLSWEKQLEPVVKSLELTTHSA